MAEPYINGSRKLGDWEFQKFREDSAGKPSISVCNPDKTDVTSTVESKQDAILAELAQKTEATQNQQVELINALRVLTMAIANPSWVDKSANALRNQVQSGTVTTVTTVTNLTNFGTQGADVTYRINSLNAWSNNVRQIIT